MMNTKISMSAPFIIDNQNEFANFYFKRTQIRVYSIYQITYTSHPLLAYYLIQVSDMMIYFSINDKHFPDDSASFACLLFF